MEFIHTCSMDIVHSDIRCSNVLFAEDGRSAFLIDFDLAAKENTPYPQDFNHVDINEHHKNAKAGYPRKKIHDQFSLKQVISSCLKEDELQNVEDWIGKLSNKDHGLNVIISELKSYHKIKIDFLLLISYCYRAFLLICQYVLHFHFNQ